MTKESILTYSAYHAPLQVAVVTVNAITALLPLFREHAHTAVMIMHSMKILKQIIEHLDPGQVPILTMDQPLFAMTKEIQ